MLKTTTESPEYPEYEYYEYEADIYKTIYNVSTYSNLYLEMFTVVVNLFHLLVLTRKDLRSIAIYIIMIGICVCDILNFLLDFYSAAVEVMWLAQWFPSAEDGWCLRDDYLEVNPSLQTIGTVTNITRHVSVWLAILMALIRTLSVLFPMSNRIQKMAKPRSALLTVFAVVLFWLVYSTWQFAFYRVFWLPDNLNKICEHLPKNTSQPRYVLAVPAFMPYLMNDLGFVEGIVKILPAVFYPILTVSLLVELRTIKKRRQNIKKNESDKSDHTTKLILFMTVTFLLSEGLGGIHAFLLYNRDAIEKLNEDLLYWILTAEYPIINLKTINAASHAFVCFLMSSQYRDVVKAVFCESFLCGKKKTNKVLRVEETRSTSLASKSKTKSF